MAFARGRHCHIEAISGQDTLEKRSNTVMALKKLATAVIRSDQPLWYEGSAEDLPPQIEEVLDAYIEESLVKWIAIIPFHHTRMHHHSAQNDAHEVAENDQ